MPSATLYYDGNTFPLDIDLQDTVEVLQLQVYSITGIELTEQILYSSLYPGPLSSNKLVAYYSPSSTSTTPLYEFVLVTKTNNALARLQQTSPTLSSSSSSPSSIDTQQQEQFKHQLLSQCKQNCTRIYETSNPIIQPVYRLQNSDTYVCHACAQNCWLPNQTSLTYLGTVDSPLPFLCQCHNRKDGNICLFAPRYGSEQYVSKGSTGELFKEVLTNSVETLYLQHRLQTLTTSTTSSSSSTPPTQGMQQMISRIRGSAGHMKAYTIPSTIEKAQKTLPIAQLHIQATKAYQKDQLEYAETSLTATTVTLPLTYPRALLNELVVWFKTKFFQWTNNIPCDHCQSSETSATGGAPPTPHEQMVGGAGMVELYTCRQCNKISRFPRYNNPAILLDTHRGRCGEWANCFTLCALTFGFEARHVVDFTDHVWTEVWLPYPLQTEQLHGYYHPRLGRWHHVDSCEAAIDAPLLYEAGWGKKLNYVFAFGLDEIIDVTRRYTKKYSEVLSRRTLVPERWLQQTITVFDQLQRKSAINQSTPISKLRYQYIKSRSFYEYRELETNIHYDNHIRKEEESSGRISGSYAWRLSRGELGSNIGQSSNLHQSTEGDIDNYALPSSYPLGVLSGWKHLEHSDKDVENSILQDKTLIQLTSWDNQFLGIFQTKQGQQQIMWQSIPASSTSTATDLKIHQWKGLPIQLFGNTTGVSSNTEPVQFPKGNERILSCVAEPKSLRFYVITTSNLSTTTELCLTLYIIQPSENKLWKAITIVETKLSITHNLQPNEKVVLSLVNNIFYLLIHEKLYYLDKELSLFIEQLPSITNAVQDHDTSTKVDTITEWKFIQENTNLQNITAINNSMLLGQSTDALYIGMMNHHPASKDTVPVFPTCTSTLQFTKDNTFNDIKISYPSVIPIGEPLSIQIDASTYNDSPLQINNDWISLTYIGQLSESSIAGRKEGLPVTSTTWNTSGILPSILDGAVQWKSNTNNPKQYKGTFTSLTLPSVSGLYELRYYRGSTLHNLIGITTIPLMMINKSALSNTSSSSIIPSSLSSLIYWVPLCPAINIQAVCGNQNKFIYAYTTSKELWIFTLPNSLSVNNYSNHSSLVYTPIFPSIDKLSYNLALLSFKLPLTVPERLAILFKQKTKGCNNMNTCTHPHCAANPKVGTLAPNLAAAQAMPLAASGDIQYFCPFMQ